MRPHYKTSGDRTRQMTETGKKETPPERVQGLVDWVAETEGKPSYHTLATQLPTHGYCFLYIYVYTYIYMYIHIYIHMLPILLGTPQLTIWVTGLLGKFKQPLYLV